MDIMIKKKDIAWYPNNSKLINADVIGQLVTPQNMPIIPRAAHNEGDMPSIFPKVHPRVAPIKNEGMISPPLKPAPIVRTVRRILIKKA